MNIYEENSYLMERINACIKIQNLDRGAFIDKIFEGLVESYRDREVHLQSLRENRRFLLEKFIDDPCKIFGYPIDLNDVLRCMSKILLSRNAYKKLDIEHNNLGSDSELICYDPVKNGQNILKHGIVFHGVSSYCGGHLPLISPNRNTKGEYRQVLFSRYYFERGNHIYLYDHKPDNEYVYLATVFTLRDLKMRFITSREIDLNKDIDNQLNMLIKIDNLDPASLDLLRYKALNILQRSNAYS